MVFPTRLLPRTFLRKSFSKTFVQFLRCEFFVLLTSLSSLFLSLSRSFFFSNSNLFLLLLLFSIRFLHGNKEELYSLIFLLFAEETSSSAGAGALSPGSSSAHRLVATNSGRGGLNNPNTNPSSGSNGSLLLPPKPSTAPTATHTTSVVGGEDHKAGLLASKSQSLDPVVDPDSTRTPRNIQLNTRSTEGEEEEDNEEERDNKGKGKDKKKQQETKAPLAAPQLLSAVSSSHRNSLKNLFLGGGGGGSNTTSNNNKDGEKEMVVLPSSSSGTTSGGGGAAAKKLAITGEKKIVDLLLFILLMLFHESSSSHLQRKAMASHSEFMRLIYLLRENDHWIFSCLSSSSSSSSSQCSFTLSGFLQSVFLSPKQPVPVPVANPNPSHKESHHLVHSSSGTNHNTIPSLLLAGMNLSRMIVTNIFHPMVNDLVPSPYEVRNRKLFIILFIVRLIASVFFTH
jgi:hypothetical protein